MDLEQLLPLFFTSGLALLLLFTVTWLIQLRTGNAAIVDAVWAISFSLMALIYFLKADVHSLRKYAMLIAAITWGLRLALHLLVRTLGHAEDIRYTVLRQEWGDKQNILMLRFYYFQALLAWILSLPFALVMINASSADLTVVEWIGIALWLIAVLGESAADRQLQKFKADTANKGKVCNEGLWFYSRHPNYFFEWMVWISFFVMALGSPWGWTTIICPVFMLYFLLKVTGIPYTETQMVKSKGQPFIEYQQTTSAFVPLPKRKA